MNFGHDTAIGLEEKLNTQKPLTVKLGFDPTSPDLHLGHFVVLRGAKKFQDLGHNVVIIVGDFTAAIGDPSGRNKLRPALSEEAIKINANTYMEQVFMVLDKDKTTVSPNSEWLGKMGMKDMLALMSMQTLAQMLVRDDFSKRFNEQTPIFMHEMVYPLMQGFDSVAIKADIELGGTDQTFNLMMGRHLQKSHSLEEQAVVTFPLLVGLDGVKKMSKSLGNHIGLKDSPTDKFGKIMSVSDDTMWNYWEVLAEKTQADIEIMKASERNPKDIKMELASLVVALFHGEEIAQQMREEFIERFTRKNLVSVEEVNVKIETDNIGVPHLMKMLNLAESVSDAVRKMQQNGVKINEEKVTDKTLKLSRGEEFILQVGKINVKKVKLS